MDRRHSAPPSTERTRTTAAQAVGSGSAPSRTRDAKTSTVAHTGWAGKRPTLWRLPLVAFLATGLVCLNYLDGRLSSDFRKSAADLAIQTDAQIETAVATSASAMHELRLLMADAPSLAEQRARFATFARAFA